MTTIIELPADPTTEITYGTTQIRITQYLENGDHAATVNFSFARAREVASSLVKLADEAELAERALLHVNCNEKQREAKS